MQLPLRDRSGGAAKMQGRAKGTRSAYCQDRKCLLGPEGGLAGKVSRIERLLRL